MRFAASIFLALAVMYPLAVERSVAAERAMIILDGSGSMWGRIGEEPKIGIAKDVLQDVLRSVPGDLELGLMVYGHREKGDCEDIETLVPVGSGSAPRIGEASSKVSPKGKTPLTESVRRAAEALKHTEEKASVILITDGIETCRADPCALARELEKTGVDFTAHVVGFGLSAEEGRQVACIADETGGLYLQASDAASLGNALTETVDEAAAAPTPPVPEAEVVEQAALPQATLDAPESIEIGRRFTVTWDGPGDRYDHVVLFDPQGNNGEGREIRGRRIIHGDMDERTVRLVAPAKPGAYELQYYYGRGKAVIGTRALEVKDAEVSLSAPATVDIGKRFDVVWQGPGGRRDSVDIIDPAGNDGEGAAVRGLRLVNGDFENRTVRLTAPAKPGFYRLRYWNGENRTVLATREIEVLEAEVGLSAPESVSMGATFEVSWVGPGGRRDAVQVVDPAGNQGDGKLEREIRLVHGNVDERTVRLPAPAKPGTYQLRYWNGENRTVLATRPIEVKEAEVSLEAEDTVVIGRTLVVKWTGPGARRDAVQLFDPDAGGGRGKVMRSMRLSNGDTENRTVKLIATATPKTLQLRYWNGDSRRVLVTRPVEVVGMDVSISGPASVKAGERFEVSWIGPGAYRDAIHVVDPEASGGRGKAVASQRLANGDYDGRKVRIKAPAKPGKYVLRYWNGDNRATLAEAAITVQ